MSDAVRAHHEAWLEVVTMGLDAEASALLIQRPDGSRLLLSHGHPQPDLFTSLDHFSQIDPLAPPHKRQPPMEETAPDQNCHPVQGKPIESGQAHLRLRCTDHLVCAEWKGLDDTHYLIGMRRHVGLAPFTLADGKLLELQIEQSHGGLPPFANGLIEGRIQQALCDELATQVPTPLIVLDGRLSVVWSNQAARETQGPIPDMLFSRAAPRNSTDLRRQLHQLLTECLQQNTETCAMLGQGEVRSVIVLTQLSGCPDLVLLRLTPVGASHQPLLQRLQALFKLTPAEAELTLQLANGHSLETIAEIRQVKRDTVRSQLKKIYSKTGYNRQNSLVSAILRIGAL